MVESQSNKAWEEETYWKHFHTVLFYQILLSDFHHRLTLPKKFSDNMRGKLPEKVTLKGPNEVTWDVNIVMGKDDVVLEGDEWEEFAKAYSLKKGDIMMFKYNRNDCFRVFFFDRSNSCEKESSYFVRKPQNPQHDHDENCTPKAGDNSVEEITDRSLRKSSSDRVDHTRDGFHDEQWDKYESSDDEDNSISEQQNSFEMSDKATKNVFESAVREVPSNSSRKRYKTCNATIPYAKRPNDTCYISNRRPVTELEKVKALKMAREKAFKFPNSFIVIMRPTSVYKRFFMSIPNNWKPKHMFRKGEEVIIQVEGKTWVCKFCRCRNYGGFQGGWKRFACENLLKEFDVCLFVPIGKKNGMYVLDVTIFRVVEEVIPPTPITYSS